MNEKILFSALNALKEYIDKSKAEQEKLNIILDIFDDSLDLIDKDYVN